MSKIFKTILPIASIALPLLLPGVGTAIGAGLGMAGTTASVAGNALLGAGLSGIGSAVNGGSVGDGLKSALIGGATGGLAGGGSSAIAGAAGLTGTGAKIASSALTGAAIGGSTGGDLKSALTGAVLGGAGAGLGSLGEAASSSLDGASALSNAPMSALSSSGAPMTTTAALQSGGSLGSLASGAGAATGGGLSSLTGGSMTLKDALSLGSTMYSGMSSQTANDKIKKQLLAAQGQAQQTLAPYTTAGAGATTQLSDALTAGFQPGDLTTDPGYQFRKQQGEESLNRALASQGMGQSGAALKAATEYGQGLADQTYNDAHSRWIAQNSQLAGLSGTGLNAATGAANIYNTMGLTNAGTTAVNSNVSNQMISSLLGNDALKQALLRGAGRFA